MYLLKPAQNRNAVSNLVQNFAGKLTDEYENILLAKKFEATAAKQGLVGMVGCKPDAYKREYSGLKKVCDYSSP